MASDTALRSRLSRLWRRTATSAPPRPTRSKVEAEVEAEAEAEEAPSRGAYPGDFTGTPDLAYAPAPDGRPDPGEIVWTWVPYEEDCHHVLLARVGRHWQDFGWGAGDGGGRPSVVRIDRILRVAATAVRREGAVLDRERFDQVAAALRA